MLGLTVIENNEETVDRVNGVISKPPLGDESGMLYFSLPYEISFTRFALFLPQRQIRQNQCCRTSILLHRVM